VSRSNSPPATRTVGTNKPSGRNARKAGRNGQNGTRNGTGTAHERQRRSLDLSKARGTRSGASEGRAAASGASPRAAETSAAPSRASLVSAAPQRLCAREVVEVTAWRKIGRASNADLAVGHHAAVHLPVPTLARLRPHR